MSWRHPNKHLSNDIGHPILNELSLVCAGGIFRPRELANPGYLCIWYRVAAMLVIGALLPRPSEGEPFPSSLLCCRRLHRVEGISARRIRVRSLSLGSSSSRGGIDWLRNFGVGRVPIQVEYILVNK
jgi:hypothetical protein